MQDKVFAILVCAMTTTMLFVGSAKAAGVARSCKPIAVANFVGSRMHIQCDQGYLNNASIIYYALPANTSDQIQRANPVISIGLTAISAGKTIGISFDDTDTSGTSFGCGASDCRAIQGVWIVP